MYGDICKDCGARLDPGGKCDCKKDNKNAKPEPIRRSKL